MQFHAYTIVICSSCAHGRITIDTTRIAAAKAAPQYGKLLKSTERLQMDAFTEQGSDASVASTIEFKNAESLSNVLSLGAQYRTLFIEFMAAMSTKDAQDMHAQLSVFLICIS